MESLTKMPSKVKIQIQRQKSEFIMDMGLVVTSHSLSILLRPIFNRGKRRNMSTILRRLRRKVSWTLLKWFNKKLFNHHVLKK